VGTAVGVAQRRLYTAGLSPVRSPFPDTGDGVRLAASLLVPIRREGEVAALVLDGKKA